MGISYYTINEKVSKTRIGQQQRAEHRFRSVNCHEDFLPVHVVDAIYSGRVGDMTGRSGMKRHFPIASRHSLCYNKPNAAAKSGRRKIQ